MAVLACSEVKEIEYVEVNWIQFSPQNQFVVLRVLGLRAEHGSDFVFNFNVILILCKVILDVG